jgi:hypothetical protein
VAFAFGGQRSIQLSYGCVGADLATAAWSGKAAHQLHFASEQRSTSVPPSLLNHSCHEPLSLQSTRHSSVPSRPPIRMPLVTEAHLLPGFTTSAWSVARRVGKSAWSS